MRGMMNASLVTKALANERNMNPGEMLKFGYEYPDSKWRFAATREDREPFTIFLTGKRMGTHQIWTRRYLSLEKAFLHVANRLNENAAVKDRYSSIEEWLQAANKN